MRIGKSDLDDKRPILLPNLRLHLNPQRSYLFEDEACDQQPVEYEPPPKPARVRAALNRDGAELLLCCTGERSLSRIVEDLKNHERSFSLRKARRFLEEAEALGHVTLDPTVSPGDSARHTGHLDRYVPSHASIEVTDQCNLDCSFCYCNSGDQAERSIDFVQLRECLLEWKALGLMVIELTGGEATTVPYFWDLVNFCAERFALTAVLTNGTNLDPKMVEQIPKERGSVFFSVSLDASTPERFKRITGGSEEQFLQVIGTIPQLVSAGHWVNVSMTVTEETVDDLIPTARLARSLGARGFACSPVLPFGRGWSVAWQWSRKSEARFYKSMGEIDKEIPGFVSNLRKGKAARREAKSSGGETCGMGKGSAVLSPSGRIRGCLLTPRSWSVGSIQETSPREIFEGEAYQSLSRIPFPSIKLCDPLCRYVMFCKGCLVRPIAACEKMGRACGYLVRSGLSDWLNRWGPGVGPFENRSCSCRREDSAEPVPRIECPHHR